MFNLIVLSDREDLKDFKYKKKYICIFPEKLEWPGLSSRGKYHIDRVQRLCYLVFRPATACWWYDSEVKIGLFSSQLSEVFWEHVKMVRTFRWDVLQLRPGLLTARTLIYQAVLNKLYSPLYNCAGFADCTNI